MTALIDRARAFWAGHSDRDRRLMAVAAVVVLFGLGYALIVDPLVRANQKLAASLPKQRAEVRLMRVQLAEIERLRGQTRGAVKTGAGLLALPPVAGLPWP